MIEPETLQSSLRRILVSKGIKSADLELFGPDIDLAHPPVVTLLFEALGLRAEVSPEDAETIIGGKATFSDIFDLCKRRGLLKPDS